MLIAWNANWPSVISFHFFEKLVSLCHEEKVIHEITWDEPTGLNSTSCLSSANTALCQYLIIWRQLVGMLVKPLQIGNGLRKWTWNSMILKLKKKKKIYLLSYNISAHVLSTFPNSPSISYSMFLLCLSHNLLLFFLSQRPLFLLLDCSLQIV